MNQALENISYMTANLKQMNVEYCASELFKNSRYSGDNCTIFRGQQYSRMTR